MLAADDDAGPPLPTRPLPLTAAAPPNAASRNGWWAPHFWTSMCDPSEGDFRLESDLGDRPV